MADMIITGFSSILLNPWNILLIFVGTLIGIIFGAIPGLTATMAISICLPLTYSMNQFESLSLLMALYIGGISGGLISAIMLNIPGTSSSVATCFDGAPLASKGQAAKALTTAIWASLFDTFFGLAALIVIAPQLAQIALKIGPFEYCGLTILSLSLVVALTGHDTAKGIISAVIGIMFATVGIAPVDSVKRFTLGFYQLNNGFDLLVVLIGIFAITEVLKIAASVRDPNRAELREQTVKMKGFGVTFTHFKRYFKNLIRSSAIGTCIGILPGVGGGVSCMVSYAAARSSSKCPDSFGKGNPHGIVASEAANNACIGGALIPLLTLGIPGDTPAAMLLGALMIQGIAPGPLIFEKHGEIMYAIYAAVGISAIFMVLLESLGTNIFIKLLKIPSCYLMPMIIVLCSVGAFSSNSRMFDVWCVLVFGILGFSMAKSHYPLPPLVLGYILGPILEENLRRSMQYMTGGNYVEILAHPAAIVMVLLAVLLTLYFVRKNMRHEKSILVEEQ